MSYWHIAQVPDGRPNAGYHLHELDPVALDEAAAAAMAEDPDLDRATAYAEALGDTAEAIRTDLGFPPRGRWANRAGWQSTLSEGVPHPSLILAAGKERVHRGQATT
jgi:hypothetical protein